MNCAKAISEEQIFTMRFWTCWPCWGVMSVTLFKISIRNAKRQAKDYLVYFVTVTLAAALIFAFNALASSQELVRLSQAMTSLPVVIVLASLVVTFVIGWLVHYTMRFMLQKRSRELGTYILLGIENKQAAGLFFRENLVVGGAALAAGIVLGNLLFQLLRAMLLWMFKVPYTFSFAFSPAAIGLTLVYFTFIYLFALLRSRKRIRRMKVCALLNEERQNETAAIQRSKMRQVIFIASIPCAIAGTALLITRQLIWGILGAVLIILFLYGFFISFSSGVPAFFDRRPRRKYTGTNLLVYRPLAAKLTTMGVTMATVAMLFTAALLAVGSSFLFHHFAQRGAEVINYDLMIASTDAEADFARYREYIRKNISVKEEYTYNVYYGKDNAVTQYIQSKIPKYVDIYKKDMVLSFSDYAALRKLLGYTEVSLKPDSYLIHSMDYLEKVMQAYDQSLLIADQTLKPGGVYDEHFTQSGWSGNGWHFILVVPDEVVKACKPSHRVYAVMAREPVSLAVYEALEAIKQEKNDAAEQNEAFYDSLSARMFIQHENALVYAMIVFPLVYLALILAMTAAAILTIQLLSDVSKFHRQYRLLRDLGMDRADMQRALRRQFIWFYAMPVVPPIVICAIFMRSLNDLFDAGVLAGPMQLWGMIGMTLAVFFSVYLAYAAVSYTSFKRNILPE